MAQRRNNAVEMQLPSGGEGTTFVAAGRVNSSSSVDAGGRLARDRNESACETLSFGKNGQWLAACPSSSHLAHLIVVLPRVFARFVCPAPDSSPVFRGVARFRLALVGGCGCSGPSMLQSKRRRSLERRQYFAGSTSGRDFFTSISAKS